MNCLHELPHELPPDLAELPPALAGGALKELRNIQMHVVKVRCNSCGSFRRETSRTGHLSYFCTARNDKYWHKQQLRIKALSIACPLYKPILK